ncbi:MAG: iron-containing alcohol dehydrogenase [Methanocorpusculum sp.]|nr:iron-containing alcohol dehydrogenase [Methanocorpusculum sp.]
MPLNFALTQRFKVVSGAGTLSTLGEIITAAGYHKAFVLYDAGIRDTGIAEKILTVLKNAGIDAVTFDKVQSDPPEHIVEEAADLCKSSGCDCVVAVGGGSTIDTGKGVTVLRFNPGHILDYANPEVQMQYSPGLISIPTTSGTGAELSNGIIISNSKTGEKVPIVGYNAMSEYVILDPELTVGMPKGLTAMTGLDAFSHAAEAYTTVLTSPIVAPICEKVMQEIAEYLPRAMKDGHDIEAREHMLIASSLGGWLLSNCCAHVGHSLAHVLGGCLHVPHGAACAYTCPSALHFIAPVVPAKVRKIGEILGAKFTGNEDPEQIAQLTGAAYKKFRDESVGMPPLSAFNVTQESAAALAPKVVVECFAPLTPRQVTEDAARAMYEEMFK